MYFHPPTHYFCKTIKKDFKDDTKRCNRPPGYLAAQFCHCYLSATNRNQLAQWSHHWNFRHPRPNSTLFAKAYSVETILRQFFILLMT